MNEAVTLLLQEKLHLGRGAAHYTTERGECIMIVKSKDAKQRKFKGVSFDVLEVGEKSMVTRMNYTAGNSVPFHQHPHEQSGYVVSGKYRLKSGGVDEILEPGDTYSIPGNSPHSFKVIEAGRVIDFFSPPREDYLS